MEKCAIKERFVPMDELMPIFREQLASGATVRFMPRGVSMLPMLRPGIDRVELSPVSGALKKYDIPLYQRRDGKYILHRIVKAGQTYTCIGDNQYQAETGIEENQIIAVVTTFYHGSKRISVTSPGYVLYCRLWHYSRYTRSTIRGIAAWLKRKLF